MKTYEYTINPGTQTEYTFYFDADSRVAADKLVKQRTKRNSKTEFVATHPVKTLQQISAVNHSSKISAQPHAFMFECTHNSEHVWMTDSEASHAFQERCSKCKKTLGAANVDPVTYKHVFDFGEQHNFEHARGC